MPNEIIVLIVAVLLGVAAWLILHVLRKEHHSLLASDASQTAAPSAHESRLTDEALQQSDDRFRIIFNNARDVITCVNDRGRMLDVNRAVEDLLGYKREELVGKRFTQLGLLAMADIPRIAHRFRRAIATGQPTEIMQLDLRRKDGHLVPVELSTRFMQVDGRVKEVISVFRDISERKATLSALAAAQQVAEAANRAKSEFLANMSHEIRTPLTAILGFADIILEATNRDEIVESANIIKRNGEHVLNVIGDILDLSKIEQGKCRLDYADCYLRQTVEDVISTMRVAAEAKGLSLCLEVNQGVPDSIRTDPIRLRQILTNLLGNAIKFTSTGGVRVHLQSETCGSETRVHFDVIDTGIGLSPEQIGKLFQPFVQAEPSPQSRYSGTGLGLAISSRLAEMLGGDITVSSERGKGSVFRLTLGAQPPDETV